LSTSFIGVKPEKIKQIEVAVIFIVTSILIGYGSVYFSKYIYIIPILIFVCLVACLAIYKFEIALFLTLFMFPLIPRYLGIDLSTLLGYGLPIVNVQRVLLGIIYLVWIFRKTITKEKILPKTILDKPILVLLLIQLCSVFVATNYLRVSFLKFLSLIFEGYLLFYIVVDTIRTKRQVKTVISVLIISLALVSVIGIVEYFLGHYVFSFVKPVRAVLQSAYGVQWTRLGTLRIQSSMGSGRILGMCLILLIPISLLSAAYNKISLKKILWSISSILLLLALYFTKSRICLIGFLVSLLVIFPVYKKYIFVIIMATLLILLLSPFFLQEEISRIKLMFSVFNPTTYFAYLNNPSGADEMVTAAFSRIRTQKAVINLILQKPILGYGLWWPPKLITTGSDVNWYSGIMLESGILVLISFFWIVIRVFRCLFNCFKNTEDRYYRFLAIALMGAISAFLVPLGTGLSTGAFYLFWVLIAIAVRIAKK